MAQIQMDIGRGKEWMQIMNTHFLEDGSLAAFTYVGPDTGRYYPCILNRNDMGSKEWAGLLIRACSGYLIGTTFANPSRPLGAVGAIIGIISFLSSKTIEGYYNTITNELAIKGKLSENDKRLIA